jgi:hypothetical protein
VTKQREKEPKIGTSADKRPRKNEVDRTRVLEYFFANPERPVKNAELAAMLGEDRTDSWTRRLRELRRPEHGGYRILSARDHSGLKTDEYWFPNQERRPATHTPGISNRIRGEVFARDAYTCQSCGLARGQRYEDGRAVTLHVGHNVADSHGGATTLENCFTLCARCNEAESNIGPDRPTLKKTMAQVRRLPRSEQREIYAFLKSVFDV